MEREMRIINWVQMHRMLSAVKRVEIVTDGMSHTIVLNIHDPTEVKPYDVKDSFYEEVDCVFNKFPIHDTKILIDFNAKVDCQLAAKVYRKSVMIMEIK
jgi:hypothetical protein